MRDYGKVSPRFWSGRTGKEMRARGRDVQAVCLYLLTCGSTNMIGLYYLPLPTLCHEVGISERAARAALKSAAEISFAFYDEDAELVWIPEMAKYQIAEKLEPNDKRAKGIVKMVEPFLKHRFGWDFLDKYTALFNLPVNATVKPLLSPSQGACKPLPSQEQEQEQEQAQDQEQNLAPSAVTPPIEESIDSVVSLWSERTSTNLRAEGAIQAVRRRVRARLREGFTPEQLAKCVDFALADAFYQSKGYAKQPSVFWKNAERVTELQTRVPEAGSRIRGQPLTASNAAVADQWEREVLEGKRGA